MSHQPYYYYIIITSSQTHLSPAWPSANSTYLYYFLACYFVIHFLAINPDAFDLCIDATSDRTVLIVDSSDRDVVSTWGVATSGEGEGTSFGV